MAAFLHIRLLLFFMKCGSFVFISADGMTTVRPAVVSEAVFTATESLFSAGTTNASEVPTAEFPTTTTAHPSEGAARREVTRKKAGQEEGPVEFGEKISHQQCSDRSPQMITKAIKICTF